MNPESSPWPLHLLPCVLIATTPMFPEIATAQAIYRCEKDGRVTFTDSPCDRPLIQDGNRRADGPSTTTQTVIGGGYASPYGPWRGQAQFQVMNVGMPSDKTHQVAPIVIDVAEDGKVQGAVTTMAAECWVSLHPA